MDWYPRENYLKRIRDFYHATDIIKVITGVRRCGKSCLMETIADELKREGIPEKNVCFTVKNFRKKSFKTERFLFSVERLSKDCHVIIKPNSNYRIDSDQKEAFYDDPIHRRSQEDIRERRE